MNHLLIKFKQYFSLPEIKIDTKVVVIFISAAILLVLAEYYDSTNEIQIFIYSIFGENIANKYAKVTLINNDYALQNLLKNARVRCFFLQML